MTVDKAWRTWLPAIYRAAKACEEAASEHEWGSLKAAPVLMAPAEPAEMLLTKALNLVK